MLQSRINKIARKIIISSGNNVFDDYFDFYSDGQWTIEVCRKLIKTIDVLSKSISTYNTNIQVLEEYTSYLDDINLDDMNTKSSAKQIKTKIKKIKELYKKYDSEETAENKEKHLIKYNDELKEMSAFIIAYESSCVNVFKNRYVKDESDVANLLDTIRENGRNVLNNH